MKVSKSLARHLRHQPERIGLVLDPQGRVAVDDLLRAMAGHGVPLSRAEREHVVAVNDERRFALDGDRVRANQGHTVGVDLGLPPPVPPAYLHHGTTAPRLDAIRTEGLRPMGRRHVHLSTGPGTAAGVGARRGRPVVLTVDAGTVHGDGLVFRVSANGV